MTRIFLHMNYWTS